MTDTKSTSSQTMQHTPGPWYASGQYVTDKPNFRIDENGTRWGDTPNFIIDAGTEANARLIAAAPDLLVALDYLLEQTVDQDLKYGVGLSEGEEDARAKALAAIAKATYAVAA